MLFRSVGEARGIAFARRLTYELHIAWEPSASPGQAGDANVVRKLLRVGGRPAKAAEEPGCMDPKAVSPEPLALLLPEHRHEYAFTFAGRARVEGRATLRIDYKSVEPGLAFIEWRDDCVTVSLPGRLRGRVWVDEESDDVVRLDEQLIGLFDIPAPPEGSGFGRSPDMVIERADSSIRYKPVAFHDPDETLMLPSSIESLTVIRGAGIPVLHKIQRFSEYKRFLADSHLVAEPK